MIRRICYRVTLSEAGMHVGAFLRHRGLSRNIIIFLKKSENAFILNGHPVHTNAFLMAEDELVLILQDSEGSSHLILWDHPISIVYEDDDLLIVNKPANMPVHPSHGHFEHTLGNAVAFRYQDENFVFRPVNRLDRDTTGLVVIARHMLAAADLSRQLQDGLLTREYLAIACGYCPIKGTIQAPLGRQDESAIAREVRYLDGESAVTHFQRLAYQAPYSLLRLQLDTGRTHQIRVHLKHIGHPIPGDFLYCPEPAHIARQALHSYRLTMLHPISRESLSFSAPLPADMQALFPQWNA